MLPLARLEIWICCSIASHWISAMRASCPQLGQRAHIAPSRSNGRSGPTPHSAQIICPRRSIGLPSCDPPSIYKRAFLTLSRQTVDYDGGGFGLTCRAGLTADRFDGVGSGLPGVVRGRYCQVNADATILASTRTRGLMRAQAQRSPRDRRGKGKSQ